MIEQKRERLKITNRTIAKLRKEWIEMMASATAQPG